MDENNISILSDEAIVSKLKQLRRIECKALAEIVRYLAELDSRQGYREIGYSSLFAFCTKALWYSGSAAQRRIVAARALRENPEVYSLLKEGKLSLCALSEVAKVITPQNKTEILTLTQGLPREEAQKLAAKYLPPSLPKRETIRVKHVLVERKVVTEEVTATVAVTPKTVMQVEERFSLNLEIDAECMELLKEAKRYSGKLKVGEVFKQVLKEYVAKRKPKIRAPKEARSQKAESRVLTTSRYIPRAIKDEVRIRDRGCCTYVAPDGTRCSETARLQLDHQEPFAYGGKSTAENLRLLCPVHNRLYAEKIFGREFILRKRVSC